MKIYVSGKIAGLSEEVFRDAFGRGCALVMSEGHTPLSPLEVSACADESCGSTMPPLADGSYQHTWDCYLRYDLIALLECDAIAMLPNWVTSRGGKLEKYVAEQCGLKLFFISGDYKRLESQSGK